MYTHTRTHAHTHRPSINYTTSETETSLSMTPESRHAAGRDTVGELQDLLEALDKARSAVQAQLNTHFTTVGRGR